MPSSRNGIQVLQIVTATNRNALSLSLSRRHRVPPTPTILRSALTATANINSEMGTAAYSTSPRRGKFNIFQQMSALRSGVLRSSTRSIPSVIHGSSSSSSSVEELSASLHAPSQLVIGKRYSSNRISTSLYTSRGLSTSDDSAADKLASSRAQAVFGILPSYLIDARSIVQYSPSTPEGALQLSVAENQLSELPVSGMKALVEAGQTEATALPSSISDGIKLVEVLSALAASSSPRPGSDIDRRTDVRVFEPDMIYYQPTQGLPSLRTALASYLQSLLKTPRDLNVENLVVGAGCNAVLENLCLCLANPGDAVMIPTPYYAAFEFDLVARAGCHIVPVNTFGHQSSPLKDGEEIGVGMYYPNRSSLDMAYRRSVEETGRAPRILLLSHPNNPLGVCYPPKVMKECIDWCREKEVHLVSDEIYAGSVYRQKDDNGDETFVSALRLASSESSEEGLGLGPYVHLVYALSKDFALSGLRVGVTYTENPEILLPLQKLNDLCQISSQTQLLVERMLCATAISDDESKGMFVDVCLRSNQDRIRARCDVLQSTLQKLNIPHLNADSGLFVWMDFREFLAPLESGVTEANECLESKERRERQLYLMLMKEYGLLFTPSMSMRNERPGFFRCVFTAASEAEFELGLERLKNFVESMRNKTS
ncbi:hypothetical protein THAOC_11717 [Thalassiosira oceanica]|uniref:Aminotransferase class I/classII large domain-containing protein n=1 Tax=Thalassiosira oceanica TaxID=159749 RepID=K0SQM2_THAOC|nr:hypothetical protein THAOC_11717 [Thalassiosira oceanica]|eukprot:EJK67284.1 hypothetical protein THAOC_11717 [Thalassiosira oceanica]